MNKKPEDLNLALEKILPNYKTASQMPTMAQILSDDYLNNQRYENYIFQEQKKFYKTIDSNGNVYLIKNPYFIKPIDGKKIYPAKIFQFNINDKSKIL